MELTKQDFDVLIEALDAWKKSGFEGRALGSIMGAMLCGNDDAMRAKMAEEEAKRDAKLKAESRVKDERAIVIQSKLIALRDSMIADRALANA